MILMDIQSAELFKTSVLLFVWAEWSLKSWADLSIHCFWQSPGQILVSYLKSHSFPTLSNFPLNLDVFTNTG
jgi:hypothetical protein